MMARYFAAVALSLSIGWGIRGNFGHETGAMIPGALAALAAVLLSGREDWLQRSGSFAFFGALGWSFGGSISYMQVIAYTHSGHSFSVWYGFACLFLIGFLWAIFGGAGTALPAYLSREQLNALYPLVFAIFGAWLVQDFVVARFVHVDQAFRQRDPLYWYDTDWLGISVAAGATLAYAAWRRKVDFGARLALWLCGGWWCGFAIFVLLLGWRMTPPRGDNWAGCTGMAVGLCVFLVRERMHALLYSAVLCGIYGGVGFALADFLKLLGIGTGLQTNWHSVLEQSYGLINGLGIAAMMLVARKTAPFASEAKGESRWAEPLAVGFVLIGITYLNLQKNVETWVKAGTVSAEMYHLSARGWFNLAYLLAALLIVVVCMRRRSVPLLNGPALGRAQLFYLVFLWWMVIGNFERAVVGFSPQRLITEGVIHLNAVLCSILVLVTPPLRAAANDAALSFGRLLRGGLVTAVLASVVPWAVIRGMYREQQIGYASRHIRFGPEATATTEKPSADKPHP